MGVISTSTNCEKLNCENYIWLYCRQYRENLDLRKFPTIQVSTFEVVNIIECVFRLFIYNQSWYMNLIFKTDIEKLCGPLTTIVVQS